MALQLVASTAADFEISNATAITNPDQIGPDLTEAFGIQLGGQLVRSRFKEDLSNFWLSCNIVTYQTGGGAGSIRFIFSNVTQWPFVSSSFLRLEFDFATPKIFVNGSSVATGTNSLTSGDNRLDVRIKIHPTDGEFSVYVNGVLSAQYIGNTAHGLTTNNALRIEGGGFNSAWTGYAISGLMVGTGDSRLLLMKSLPLSGDGFYQEWTGSYTDIDDTGGVDDNNFILAAAPAMVSTFQVTEPTTPVGYDIRAIVLSAQLAKYGEDVTGVNAVWYDGVDVEVMGEFTRLDVGYTNDQVISESNPVTGLRYTDSDLASFQLGVQTT